MINRYSGKIKLRHLEGGPKRIVWRIEPGIAKFGQMTLHFILSHPAVPENIGFATRAINTMGFGQLRLVNPCDHLSSPAKKTAYGSHHLLESALVFPSLAAALEGMSLSIATSAKKRLARHDYYSPPSLAGILDAKNGVVENVAVVFGNERDGLSKEEIDLCDIISTIPLAAPYPSLNLAQSVLIYAYELSKNQLQVKENPTALAQPELKEKALQILADLDMPRQASLYRRLKDRIMTASAEDTKLMLSFARFLVHRLKNPGSSS